MTPAWREPVHVVADEDTSVPQTLGGWSWLSTGTPVALSDPALIVLADAVDTLGRCEGGVHDCARDLVARLCLLYGLAPRRADGESQAA